MADVNQIYQSEFLRAAQLGGQTRRVTIESAAVEVLGQGEKAQQKIVLRFMRVKPRLPLNKTNATTLAAEMGPKTDNWIGRQVDLRPERVLFSGSMVDSIRVQAVPETSKGPPSPPTGPPSPPAAPALAPTGPPAAPIGDAAEPPGDWSGEELADDIPWEK